MTKEHVDRTLVGGFVLSSAHKNPHSPIVSVENPRADELSGLTEGAQGRWDGPKKENSGRRSKLCIMTLDKSVLDTGDPQYLEAIKNANNFRRHRQKEMYTNHGYVSSGVAALLTTSALALASSRYMYEKAALNGDVDLMKKAAQLGDSARSNELAAWELCAREGQIKRKHDMDDEGTPWIERITDSGRKRRGRRHNAVVEVNGVPVSQTGMVVRDAGNDSGQIKSGS